MSNEELFIEVGFAVVIIALIGLGSLVVWLLRWN